MLHPGFIRIAGSDRDYISRRRKLEPCRKGIEKGSRPLRRGCRVGRAQSNSFVAAKECDGTRIQ